MYEQIDCSDHACLSAIDRAISSLQRDWPRYIYDFQNHIPFLFASDYSGQNDDSGWESYSFLVTDQEAIELWAETFHRSTTYKRLNGREMKFAKLRGDRVRRDTLLQFLDLVADIRGHIVTFSFEKTAGGLHSESNLLLEVAKENLPSVNSDSSARNIVTVSTLAAFISAGFGRRNPHHIWLTDRDETVDRPQRYDELMKLTEIFIGMFAANHEIRRANAYDEKDERGPSFTKEVISICDLFAGAARKLGSKNFPTARATPDDDIGEILSMTRYCNSPLRPIFLRTFRTDAGGNRSALTVPDRV
ncbi:MAG: hypothetical protein AAGJ97_10855 [Planctomycetota bacterium]